MTRRTALPYRDAIRWIIDNDDTEWLDDEEPVPTVTAALVADIYGRSEEEIIKDLRRTRERELRDVRAEFRIERSW